MSIYTVAIDGPAGAGKSTLAKRAAAALGFVYVDTGAIYRTVAYAVHAANCNAADPKAVEALLSDLTVSLRWAEDGAQHMLLNGEDVSAEIRSPEISHLASLISAIPAVRQFLLDTQRNAAKLHSVILDGRDIGTVVFPHADVKIYLTASAECRARRRFEELCEKSVITTYEEVLAEMKRRDERDMNREIAPLRRAEDAVLLDTSELTLTQSVEAILYIIREKLCL